MPWPGFDKTVAPLDEAWFFGPEAGANYRRILTEKFAVALNKPQIDQALSLGNYLWHSVANKRKRAALRAVLLAKFLIRSHPVSLRDRLKQRYENLDLESLKRAFANDFPALMDSGNRPLWNPANFDDPSSGALGSLRRSRSEPGPHSAVPSFRFIIHGVGDFQGPVFQHPGVLTQYEVLSMSLMSHLNSHAHDPQGVILRVPANNILAASPRDVAVLNYAPAFDPQNPNAVTIAENLVDVAVRTGGLRSPDYLLEHIRPFPYYNEVVVCGRAGVPLPHGTTGAMMTVGLFILTDPAGTIQGNEGNRDERKMRVEACAQDHGLPLLYIPNRPHQASSVGL